MLLMTPNKSFGVSKIYLFKKLVFFISCLYSARMHSSDQNIQRRLNFYYIIFLFQINAALNILLIKESFFNVFHCSKVWGKIV